MSPGAFATFKTKLTQPSPFKQGDITVYSVHGDERTVALRTAVMDAISAPLEEANRAREQKEQAAAERKARKAAATRGAKEAPRGEVPSTKRARFCGAKPFLDNLELLATVGERMATEEAVALADSAPAMLRELSKAGPAKIGVRSSVRLIKWRYHQLSVTVLET